MTLSAIGHYFTTIAEDVGIIGSPPKGRRFDSMADRVASLTARLCGGFFATTAAVGVISSAAGGFIFTGESRIALFLTIGLGVTAHDCIRVGENLRKNCNITDRG